METTKNHYETLGISTTASKDEIKKAFRQLSLQYHPDKNPNSIDKFKEDFVAAGVGQFGSGWCWLVKDTDGQLKITKTENGVNPLCFNQKTLLGCDVWEHSYYIDFRNKRPVYIMNFLDKLVNWEYVASQL